MKPSSGSVSVIVETSCHHSADRLYVRNFNPLPYKFIGDEPFSLPFTVIFDQAADYTVITAHFSFVSIESDFKTVKIKFQVGNPEFIIYEMIFRILFSMSLIIFFFFHGYSAKYNSH